MKKKRIIILIAQITVTLLVGIFLFSSTNSQLESEKAYVYNITSGDLNRPLTKEDIKEIAIPKRAVSNEIELKESNIIGKYVDRKITKGHIIYKDELMKLEDIDEFASMDLSEKRKISLPITYVEGLSGNLKKGDRIDLAYIGAGETEESDFRYSKVFMQDVPIWSVNTGEGYQFVDKSLQTEDDYGKEEQIDSQDADGDLQIITLAVSLEQAEEILARSSAGTVSFVGRFDDSKNYDSMGFVLGEYEKIFSGKGHAETSRTSVFEDDFEEIFGENDNE